MSTENVVKYLAAISDTRYSSVEEVVCDAINQTAVLDAPDDGLIRDALIRAALACVQGHNVTVGHDSVVALQFSLGASCTNLGRSDLAVSIFESILKDPLAATILTPTIFAQIHSRKGSAHLVQGQYELAECHQRVALHLLESENETLLAALAANNLGLSLIHLDRLDEALHYLAVALEIRTAKLGPLHIDTLATRLNVAATTLELGPAREGALLILSCARALRASQQGDSVEYANCFDLLAAAAANRGDFRRARRFAARSIRVLGRLGVGHALRANTVRKAILFLDVILDPASIATDRADAHAYLDAVWGPKRS